MPVYKAPVDDVLFLLNDVFHIERFANLPGFAEASPDVVQAIVAEAAKFCEEVLAPLNPSGDRQGCRRGEDGSVTTPSGFTVAYRRYVAGGWIGISVPQELGGLGLPGALTQTVNEFLASANMAFAMYPTLTQGAIAALIAHGTAEQKSLYLPKMLAGEWTGTMNLTEPQCGTDLGLIRTKAVPQSDGSYRITGTKIFISAGEHDLAENIVHLVLARIEGAPEGTRGLSLFVVPKFIPHPDGSLGARNAVSCGSIEDKMGIHGNATCVISHEEATGWLIGQENRGLALMFVMMNEARLGVALQGLAVGEAAYQAAAAFAKDRLQGRSLTGPKNADGPADPILVHPDVRRMLMDSRAVLEGGRAFLFWTALQGDLARRHPDEAVRQKAEDYMALLTPVLKGFLTDRGFKIASDAMQVHGGSGFTEHFPASQYLRDVRITLIYEGTNGIQALDLVGRKLAANGGRGVMTFFAEIDAFVEANHEAADLKPFVDGLAAAKAQLQEATFWLMQNGVANPDSAAAASTDYLQLFGLAGAAFGWAMSAKAALAKVAGGDGDPFYANKLAVGRYYLERVLPETATHLTKLKTGAQTLMALPADAF